MSPLSALRRAAAVAVLASLAVAWLPSAPRAEEVLDPAQRQAVEQVIRDYLLAHPELLIEVMDALEKKQKAQAQANSAERIEQHQAAIYFSPHDFVLNPGGPIPVVEFFDYQCGYCKRMLPTVMQIQAEEPRVRFIYKEFPILGEASVFAARAAIAARRQDKYVALHNALMGLRGSLDEEVVMQVAADVGLDVERLRHDMAGAEVQAAIETNYRLAEALGIRGTPTLIVGDALVPGAIDQRRLAELIEEAATGCRVC